MKYTKVREVKDPIRGTPQSAGIDFFVPKFTKDFLEALDNKNEKYMYTIDKTNKNIHLAGHGRLLIPSGIHVNLPKGTALIAHNKSGVATKKGLDRLAEVVDEDYQGEVHISIVNTSNGAVEIKEDEKLIQFLLFPILYSEPHCFSDLDELYDDVTERGAGGFGSTGS